MNRTLFLLACLFVTPFLSAQFHEAKDDGTTSQRQMFNPYSRMAASPGGYMQNARGIHNSSIQRSKVHALVISDKIAENAQHKARYATPALKGVPGTRDHGDAILNALNGGEGTAQFPINKDVFKPEKFFNPETNELYGNIGLEKTTMAYRQPDVWGRCQNHTDGTYTETIFDIDKRNPGQMRAEDGLTVVIQRTRRPSLEHSRDPILLTRKIYIDQFGVPKKVDIFDGNNQLKFKGIFIYDEFNRLAEEQTYQPGSGPAAKPVLVRRKVFPYDKVTAKPLSPLTWDYVETSGLQLVSLIRTRRDEIMDDKIRRLEEDVKKGIQGKKFRNKRLGTPTQSSPAKSQTVLFKNRSTANQTPVTAAPSSATVEPLEKKKKWNFFRKN